MGTPSDPHWRSVGKNGWLSTSGWGCMRLRLLPCVVFVGWLLRGALACCSLRGTQRFGSVRACGGPVRRASGAAWNVASDGRLGSLVREVVGAGAVANKSSILPGTTLDIAIIGVGAGLRFQEGAPRFRFLSVVPPLAR